MGMFKPNWFRGWMDASGSRLPDDAHRPHDGDHEDTAFRPTPIWVIHASETGLAEDLAQDACRRLAKLGRSNRLVPLDAMDAPSLASIDQALFLASTTGDGDPPGLADIFVRRCMQQPARLPNLHYGLLALGDHRYDDFCAFGRQLHQWLRASGAQTLFEPVEMDNEDPSAMRQWNERVELLGKRVDRSTRASS
jgi:sulfite reductase (NADPH) flavoprotein alpha-component